MPSRPPRYEYDDASRRFRDRTTGRFVPEASVRAAIDQLAETAATDARALSERLMSGDLALGEWQRQMASLIRTSQVAAGLATSGGAYRADQETRAWIGQRVRDQLAYLNDFARDVGSGAQRADGVLARRAAMYGESARATAREMERRVARIGGLQEERNVLAPSEHCGGCLDATAAGWQPIGTLPPIGGRQCLSGCKCVLLFRSAQEDAFTSAMADEVAA